MNRHAQKLVTPRTSAEEQTADAVLGGILEDHYLCAGCGRAEARPAQA